MNPPTPPGALSDSATKVLLAVTEGNYLYTDLMEATGLKRNALWHRLHDLRAAGLVEWDSGRMGTLRPTVGITNTRASRG